MEVAYSIVESAKEDLIDLIFSFIKDMMQVSFHMDSVKL